MEEPKITPVHVVEKWYEDPHNKNFKIKIHLQFRKVSVSANVRRWFSVIPHSWVMGHWEEDAWNASMAQAQGEVTGSPANHSWAQGARFLKYLLKEYKKLHWQRVQTQWNSVGVSGCQHQSVLKIFYVSVFRTHCIHTKGMLPYSSVCHRKTDQRIEVGCCLGRLTGVIMGKQNYRFGSMEVPGSQS